MEALIRYPGVSKHQPAIDVWLSQQDAALGELARAWFARLRQCGDDVYEVLHDRYSRRAEPQPSVGGAIACVTDAPLAYVNVFRGHVNLGFYQGVKLRPGRDVSAASLQALIEAAYADMKARVAMEAMPS